MLTNEIVLNVFADYLKEDNDYEVVMTSRGYTVMCWDSRLCDWSEAVFCGTPEKLRDTLLDAYFDFAQMKITGCKRDLSPEERQSIQTECDVLKERCNNGASQ